MVALLWHFPAEFATRNSRSLLAGAEARRAEVADPLSAGLDERSGQIHHAKRLKDTADRYDRPFRLREVVGVNCAFDGALGLVVVYEENLEFKCFLGCPVPPKVGREGAVTGRPRLQLSK